MSYLKYLLLVVLIAFPLSASAQAPAPDVLDAGQTDLSADELTGYYDLRDRSSYVQVTNIASGTLCIHVQVFQNDRGCSEIDFEDELTANDTVVYDLDNIVKNNGNPVPANLNDDSYGYVAVSAFQCGTNPPNDDGLADDSLIGNVRILDDAGYEYRYNMIGEADGEDGPQNPAIIHRGGGPLPVGNPVIRFNTVDGSNQADIVGYVYQVNRDLAGNSGGFDDRVRNISQGATFSVFQVDENEERLSCDVKNFACGGVMNYGINDDFGASRGNNLLCEGGGLIPGQTHGYISLENASVNDGDTNDNEELEFVCLVGLNNGNGTGSMDECSLQCTDDNNDCVLD
ncbi:MAG: hypothetical protein GTO02_08325 [Candidatus Dadabacteria bacterium]|nr:hypothetical protein [Candidatus Dadabacteria bacterium]NIQ14393.1 hypothetical protein [Candidatus Dadabacteria bacterium]